MTPVRVNFTSVGTDFSPTLAVFDCHTAETDRSSISSFFKT